MMNHPEASDSVSTVLLLWGRLVSGFRWLSQPTKTRSESERRRAQLLVWLLLFLIFLSIITLLLVLMIDPPGSSRRSTYLGLIPGLILMLIFAFLFNRAGHYYLAAALTMAFAVAGPWSSILLDPTILQGDFVPLTYVALTILLSSILLRPMFTVILAAVQLLALALLPLFTPATASINWPSLLAMIFFTSVLSILVNVIHERDMEQIERQTRQLAHSNGLISALAHITTDIQGVISPDQIVRVVGENLQALEITCAAALYHEAQESFSFSYTSMEAPFVEQLETYMGLPFLGYAFSTSKLRYGTDMPDISEALVVSEPAEEIQIFFPQRLEQGLSSLLEGVGIGPDAVLLRLPLLFEERILGILWVWGKNISGADLSSMSIFAKHISVSLERARLFQEVQGLAFTDPLTGLKNRRSLFELGRIEFSRAQRMNRHFSCMMLDVDHFKQINDSYGHLIGDQVLQEVAKRCQSSVREIDLAGRYGGEEFVILLPETDVETAKGVAERLRACIEATPITASGQELQVTTSIGVSAKDENTLDLETLIARADQALYIAKYQGRNRVVTST